MYILKYFLAPVVGLVTVLLLYEKKYADYVNLLSNKESLGMVVILLSALGITVYYFHRTIHPLFSIVIFEFISEKKPTRDELVFGRWERRGFPAGTLEKSVQSALDESNVATHFFYCSFWSSLIIACIYFLCGTNLPTDLNPFIFFVVGYFIIAFLADYQMTNWDLKAYKRFQEKQKDKILKIAEVLKFLQKGLCKVGYEEFSLDKPEIGRDVIVGFSVQDIKADRDDWTSKHVLKESITKALDGSNWKLMSDGVSCKLGYLTGRLRGQEKQN